MTGKYNHILVRILLISGSLSPLPAITYATTNYRIANIIQSVYYLSRLQWVAVL